MQQGAFYKGGFIQRDLPFFHEIEADICNVDAVLVDGRAAMLHGFFFFIKSSLKRKLPDGIGEELLPSGG